MKISQLRNLFEFAPNRTQFTQVLGDQSISMGFECEMVTPYSTGSGEGYRDVSNMDWDDVQSELQIGSRTENRIERACEEWQSEQISEMMMQGWREEKEDYTLAYCIDNDHLIRQTVVDVNGTTITLKSVNSVEQNMNAIDDEGDSVVIKSVDLDERQIMLENPFDVEPSPGDRLNFTPYGKSVDDVLKQWRDEARDAYEEENRDHYYDQVGDMDDFIRAEYSSMESFLDSFNISYGSDDDDEDDSSVLQDIAAALGPVVNKLVKTTGTHSKNPANWYVEPDGSLEGYGYATAEVVSSVYPLDEGLTMLKTIFDWMGKNRYSTNSTTGLHVSFSIAGLDETNFDFLKMMVLFDENYTAQIFNRLGARYAQQMRNILFAGMNTGGRSTDIVASLDDRQLDNVIATVRRITSKITWENTAGAGNAKYFSFRHRSNGVVEFRSMGGHDYEKMYEVIRKRIVNMAYLMKVGSDPKAMERDYVARLYKMLTSGKFADPKLGSGIGRVDQPQSLGAFAHVMGRDAALTKLATTNPLQFINSLIARLNRVGGASGMTPVQVRQLRWYVSRNKIQPAEFRKNRTEAEYNEIATLMRWPLIIPGQHDPHQQPLGFAMTSNRPYSPGPQAEPKDSEAVPRFRGPFTA